MGFGRVRREAAGTQAPRGSRASGIRRWGGIGYNVALWLGRDRILHDTDSVGLPSERSEVFLCAAVFVFVFLFATVRCSFTSDGRSPSLEPVCEFQHVAETECSACEVEWSVEVTPQAGPLLKARSLGPS